MDRERLIALARLMYEASERRWVEAYNEEAAQTGSVIFGQIRRKAEQGHSYTAIRWLCARERFNRFCDRHELDDEFMPF